MTGNMMPKAGIVTREAIYNAVLIHVDGDRKTVTIECKDADALPELRSLAHKVAVELERW